MWGPIRRVANFGSITNFKAICIHAVTKLTQNVQLFSKFVGCLISFLPYRYCVSLLARCWVFSFVLSYFHVPALSREEIFIYNVLLHAINNVYIPCYNVL